MPGTKKGISFLTLFEKLKFKVIRHFLITSVWTILSVFLLAMLNNLLEGTQVSNNNYFLLLPKQFQKYFFPSLTKENFIFLVLFFISLYAISLYFASLWEEELRIKGGHYVKNRLLNKFRQLPFEERQKRSKEINTLVELDSSEVGYTWEHLPNHVYHSLLTIILLLLINQEKFIKMSGKGIAFSCFWLLLINIVSYFFTKLILRNEKKHKKELTQEWAVINKESTNSNLIESMGLTSQYREEQRKISQKNENLLLSFGPTKSLNKTVPGEWLVWMFPYLLLFTVGTFSEAAGNILPIWFIFENFQEIFKCFWEYGEYASSLTRVNSFLALPEKDDNLGGVVLPKQAVIKTINFEKASFKYKNSSEWILKDYTRSFTKGEINRLLGENGVGKSTILYLILGVLSPQEGRISIITESGKTYELQSINLKYWRESTVAYASHDNLIEKGSTGQRQLANLNQLFSQKNQAAIFLFDEADNALDQDNQKKFSQQLEKLSKNKLVIYTKH